MDAQRFLAEFGHIVNAPGGVVRLREMVLALAVRGDLFRLEREWTKRKLNDLGDWAIGSGFPKQEQGQISNSILFVKVSDMNLPENQKFIVTTNHTITESTATRLRIKIHPPGTVVFPKIGGAISTNKRRILTQPTAIDNNCLGLIPKGEATTEWLFLVLSSIDFSRYQAGTSVPALSQGTLAEIPSFLPSREEQSRIVAKVDELMALCDKLEAQQQARRKLQNNLRQSTLQAVASATSPHELQAAWSRLSDNFGRLFHAPEDVADLRQVTLDLAFTGNISEQSESVTSNLVESLHLRKMQLSAEKRIKRETPVIDFPGIAEMLGSIPDQWAWVRLNDIASVVRGGSPRPAGDPKFYGGSIPFLKVADVTAAKGMFVERFTSTITEAGLNKTREIFTRTVLLTNSGATLGVPAICEFRTTFNDGIAAFVELNDAVFDEYLYLFLKSKTKWLQDIASRGQGQPNLNTEIIRSMWFPLAPISEQHRIVTRVSELMRFCDVLEANLKHASMVGRRLAVAAVSSLTGIATDQQEQPMKIPQTELIAPLRLGAAPDIKAQAPLATILARNNGEISAKDLWQRFGGEIDAFYAQLKTEVAHGWILEPAPAEMREKPAEAVGA